MGITFNADEVFQMAVKIEKNGAAFYRKAASFQEDSDSKSFLEGLAAMEDEHQSTFESMRGQLTGDDTGEGAYDPQGEIGLYLDALSDAHGGEGAPSVADQLDGSEPMEKILMIAIDLEKQSILYYVGLKEMTPERLGKDKIDAIIAEERKHVIQLAKVLRGIK